MAKYTVRKNYFGLIDKSDFEIATMHGDDLLYVICRFRGHVYRVEGGRITAADDEDRRVVSSMCH